MLDEHQSHQRAARGREGLCRDRPWDWLWDYTVPRDGLEPVPCSSASYPPLGKYRCKSY